MKSRSDSDLIAEYWQVICYVDGERRGPICDTNKPSRFWSIPSAADGKTAILWTTQFGSRGAARFRARALRQESPKTITYKVVHIRRYRAAKP